MKKADIHNLYELQFAKKVVKELPEIIKKLDKIQGMLYNHIEYRDVADVLYAVNDAKTMLEIHYNVYKPVVERKGKVIYGEEE